MLTDGTVMQYNVQPTEGKTVSASYMPVARLERSGETIFQIISSTELSGATEIKGYVVTLDRISGVRRGGSGSNNINSF